MLFRSKLKRAGVHRALEGFWSVPDARERPAGEAWGLTGVRAEGQPGARMTVAFGVGEEGGDSGARLGLYYLEHPGMGAMEVRVDGETVARLPEREPVEEAAQVASWPVKGRSHIVEVLNVGRAPVTVFGAALDLERPGVRYDALGLPGSTSMMADGFDKRVYARQLRARAADLYVLFYGTNESAISRLDPEKLRRHYTSLLATLRRASPRADCLILGPTDRLKRDHDRWVEAPSINTVIRVLRELARDENCGFWSARAAMGGPRSIARWQQLEPPLGHPDGVHLTRRGYETLAHSFTDDLLGAYRAWLAADGEPVPELPEDEEPTAAAERRRDAASGEDEPRSAGATAPADAEAQGSDRQRAADPARPDAEADEDAASGEGQ